VKDAYLREITEDIYAYIQPDGSWYLNNTGFLAGRRGVIAIDASSTQRRTHALIDAIASVSHQPIRTLVNTHHHGDHTYGNYLFENATIVGHERTRTEVQAFGLRGSAGIWEEIEWGNLELAPPFLTYSTGVTLWSDDLRADVRYVGMPAHTTNDSIIHIAEKSVLFCGDLLFNGGTPFLLLGSISGSIKVLKDVIRPLGARTIIPGHGPVCGPELIDDVLGYLAFVTELAREGKAAALSPLEAARQADLGAYAAWTDAERLVGNLHRAYAELEGGEPGVPLDVMGALRDMVAYNGGKPLSCHA
jgi:cyclase